MDRPLGAEHVETRDGREVLIYDCGCYAFQDGSHIRILPCAEDHEQLVTRTILDMLEEMGIRPVSIDRKILVKN